MMELKFVAGTGIFEGYASVFHVTDSANDIIVPGAFAASIAAFEKAGKFPPLLWQHDVKAPIGAWREMREDEHGLFVRGELFVETSELAKEAQKLMEEKVVTGLSIGYRVKKSHKDEKTGARVLEEIALLEISMVTFPANEHARIIAPGDELPTEKSLETLLRGAGLSRRQAKSVLACGYKALREGEQSDDADLFYALSASIDADTERLHARKSLKRSVRDAHLRRAAELEEVALKYSPSQPRVPSGNSTGGQWTATGASSAGSNNKPVFVPREKPKPLPPGAVVQMPRARGFSQDIIDRARSINRRAPDDIPASELEIDPITKLPRWYAGGAVGSTLSPLDFIGGWGGLRRGAVPEIGGAMDAQESLRIVTEAIHRVNAVRLKIFQDVPAGVTVTSTGKEALTVGQLASLKRAIRRNPSIDKIEVTNYSDGRSIISMTNPSDKVPGSYKVFEKQVSLDGKAVKAYAYTVTPAKKIANVKNKLKE